MGISYTCFCLSVYLNLNAKYNWKIDWIQKLYSQQRNCYTSNRVRLQVSFHVENENKSRKYILFVAFENGSKNTYTQRESFPARIEYRIYFTITIFYGFYFFFTNAIVIFESMQPIRV